MPIFEREPRRGSMPRASDLAQVYQHTADSAPEHLTGTTGGVRSVGPTGLLTTFAEPRLEFWAQITGAPTGKQYPWFEVVESNPGYFTQRPDGFSGGSTGLPAYEASGAITDFTSEGLVTVIVRMRLSDDGTHFLFSAPTGSTSGYTGTLTVLTSVTFNPSTCILTVTTMGLNYVNGLLQSTDLPIGTPVTGIDAGVVS